MGIVGEGEHVTEMVKKALDVGYRHIDTVSIFPISLLPLLFIGHPAGK